MAGGVGNIFGTKKYLWGNVPALDVLRLDSNEGVEYDGPLRVLFAGIYHTTIGPSLTHLISLFPSSFG